MDFDSLKRVLLKSILTAVLILACLALSAFFTSVAEQLQEPETNRCGCRCSCVVSEIK